MGNLVLTRKPGQSIDVYDPERAEMGVVTIMQGKIRGNKSWIAIDAPKHMLIKRSELVGKEADILSENKYWLLGPDPLAAIAAIGFTREMTGFARGIHQHETLALDIQHDGSQRGWVCGVIGERAEHRCESLGSLKDYVLGVALVELKKRGAK